MTPQYLIYSPTKGYWNIAQGWVSNVNDATHFSYGDTQLVPLPTNDSEWVDFQY